MSFVVGVTGGIGSGKSALTARLETKGITVVDADLASRVIVEPGKPALAAIAEHFGVDILLPDGNLDRAALRREIFADPTQRQWLEQLTHPLIGEEIGRQLQASRSAYTVLSSPLLLETSQGERVDYTVVVDVDVETQLARTVARDNNDAAQVQRIIAAQIAREERLARADWVVDNSGSLADLNAATDSLHLELLRLAQRHKR